MILVSPSLPVRVYSKGLKCFAHLLCYSVLIGSLTACTLDVFDYKKKSPTSASSAALSFPDQNALTVPPAPSGSNANNSTFNPALGLSTDRLFAEPIRDVDSRFLRLENAVQQMRDEIDSVSPAINRLVAVEGDIQNLIEQLEVLLEGEPMLAPDPFADFKGFDMVSPVTEDSNFKDTRPEALEPVMKAEGMMSENLKKGVQIPSSPVETYTPTPAAPTSTTPSQAPTSLSSSKVLLDADVKTADEPTVYEQETFISPPAKKSVTTATPDTPVTAPQTFNPPSSAEPEQVTETQTMSQDASASNANGTLKLVRMADNGGKVRIVIESTRPVKPVINLDNDENILLVDVTDGYATLEPAGLKTTSRHVDSATINKRDVGYALVFGLNKEGRITDQNLLAPGSVSPNYRYYVDFTPLP